jgi:hypothetical protein
MLPSRLEHLDRYSKVAGEIFEPETSWNLPSVESRVLFVLPPSTPSTVLLDTTTSGSRADMSPLSSEGFARTRRDQ